MSRVLTAIGSKDEARIAEHIADQLPTEEQVVEVVRKLSAEAPN